MSAALKKFEAKFEAKIVVLPECLSSLSSLVAGASPRPAVVRCAEIFHDHVRNSRLSHKLTHTRQAECTRSGTLVICPFVPSRLMITHILLTMNCSIDVLTVVCAVQSHTSFEFYD